MVNHTPHPISPPAAPGQASTATHTRHRILVLDDNLPKEAPLIVLVHGEAGQGSCRPRQATTSSSQSQPGAGRAAQLSTRGQRPHQHLGTTERCSGRAMFPYRVAGPPSQRPRAWAWPTPQALGVTGRHNLHKQGSPCFLWGGLLSGRFTSVLVRARLPLPPTPKGLPQVPAPPTQASISLPSYFRP